MKIWEVEHAETVCKVSRKYGPVQGMGINLYSKYHDWVTLSQCVPISQGHRHSVLSPLWCFPCDSLKTIYPLLVYLKSSTGSKHTPTSALSGRVLSCLYFR